MAVVSRLTPPATGGRLAQITRITLPTTPHQSSRKIDFLLRGRGRFRLTLWVSPPIFRRTGVFSSRYGRVTTDSAIVNLPWKCNNVACKELTCHTIIAIENGQLLIWSDKGIVYLC